MISKEKWQALKQKMQDFGLQEKDVTEAFILGTGKGGQKINKTHSCVYLKHAPTGIEIKCQKARSRDDNRYFARRRLLDKLLERTMQEKGEAMHAIHKMKKQKARRSRRAKQKMLADKGHHALIKKGRQKPAIDND